MLTSEPPLNPPDINWDKESWAEHEREQEAREEKEWAKGWDNYYEGRNT